LGEGQGRFLNPIEKKYYKIETSNQMEEQVGGGIKRVVEVRGK